MTKQNDAVVTKPSVASDDDGTMSTGAMDAVAQSGMSARERFVRRGLNSSPAYMFGVLIVMFIVFSILAPSSFPHEANLKNVVVNTSILLVMAVGMTYIMVAAGFDLSIGSVLVFSGIIASKVMSWYGGQGYDTLVLGLIAAIASGLAWGLFNGFCITVLRVPALITTLGTLGAALGAANIITNGNDVATVPKSLLSVQTADWLGFPPIVWLMLVIVLVGGAGLRYTRFGRHTYIVGSNDEAARRAGINVDRHLVKLYALGGALSGLAGMMSLIQFSTTTIGSHGEDALNVITGVILGGTSLYGGAGAVLGTVIGMFIPGLTGNPFYNTVSCGAGTEAKKKGVNFSYQGSPTFDVQKQTQVLNAVTATKPGAIMISITDPQAMISPLKQAKAAGIKIVTSDRDLTDTSVSLSNIQADGKQGGKLAGEAMGKAVGGKGSVLIVDNATGSIVSKARTDGFKEGIAEFPNMKVLNIQYSANDISKAASIVSTAATTNSDLVGVFGAETNNTQGALTGVREAGKAGKIKVVGFDTSDPIVAALKNGSLLGTAVQNPRGEGVTGVDTAIAAMQGQTVPRNQSADSIFVTPATVNTATAQAYIYDVNCKIQ